MAKSKEPKANTPVFDAMCKEIEDRIGVSVESMSDFRAMIKDYRDEDEKRRSYYREKSTVLVRRGIIEIRDVDGSSAKACEDIIISYTEKIQIEWEKVSATLPKSEYATIEQAEKQREVLGVSPANWYIMLDITRKRVIMCQRRVENEDGSKEYWPYTFFKAEGWFGWRNKEPNTDDFKMPFWKPVKRRLGQLLMVHEGAKAAMFVDNLINNTAAEWIERRNNHPWAKYLSRFEHWGIIGGALAPHRADYAEIIKGRKPERTVYVCDRDNAGEAAVSAFSRYYKGKLDALRFDARFDAVKQGWDMADDLPKEMFNDDGFYKGEPLDAFLRPATWATGEKIIEPEAGNPNKKGPKPRAKIVHHITDNFLQDWVHVVNPELYIHRRLPDHSYSMDEFNNRVRPFSNIRDTSHLFQQYEESKIDSIDYNPTKPPGIVKKGRKLSWNIHHGGFIEPKRGDLALWTGYLDQTFPVQSDRQEVEKWIYTLIACPHIKMHYGLLLCSEQQGVGKTTLGQNVLAPILGEHNVSYPSESDIVDSQFTHWKANVRLILANEIYAGHSSRAYNKLKDLMTDHIIRVNKKFMAEYNQINWAHMIACSNSLRALKIPDEDRRWCVPKVTEKKQPVSYWREFNQWLINGGLSCIMQEAFDWGRRKGNSYASIGEAAPDTVAKRKMVEENYSKGQTLIKDWLEAHADTEEKNGAVVVADRALVDLILYEVYGGRPSEYLERPLTVRKVAARTPGWHVGRLRQTVLPPYGKGFLLANRPELADLGPTDIENLGIKVYRDYNSLPK